MRYVFIGQSTRFFFLRLLFIRFIACVIACSATWVLAQEPVEAEEEDSNSETDANEQVEELVVYGRRLDAELSISAKRNSDQIMDALTAAEASRLPDNNLAEMLGRISGVSFRRSGETGNGDYIAIRGLDSALNTISFDNVKSGSSSLSGRRVPLDGITTEDVAELRIAKSLLPHDPGEGIGGTIEVTSRKPLDYEESGLRLTSDGRFGEFSDAWGHRTRLSYNTKFNDRLAGKVSLNYRKRQIRNFEMDASSSNLLFLPEIHDVGGNVVSNDLVLDDLDDPGSSFDNVHSGFFPLDAMTFEEHTYEVQDQQRDTLYMSGALQWQATETTSWLLGGRFSRQKALATENSIAFDNDDDDFEEIGGTLYTIFDDPELDFEAQIEDEVLVNNSMYLKMETELDRSTWNFQFSYANAKTSAPETDIDFDTGSLLDDETVTWVPFTFVGTYFPIPQSNVVEDEDYVEAITDIPGTQILDDFTMDLVNERVNDRMGFKFDMDYVWGFELFGGVIEDIRTGFQWERSEVADDFVTLVELDAGALNLDGTFNPENDGTGEGENLEDFEGLFGGFVSLEPIGNPIASVGLTGIPILDEGAFRSLISNFQRSFLESGEEPYSTFFFDGEEDVYSAYVEARFVTGPLSVIGGVRVEQYRGQFASPLEFDASLVTVNLLDPQDEDTNYAEVIDLRSDADASTVLTNADNFEVLPRVNAIYVMGDQAQLRFGAGYSIARPSLTQLGRSTSIDFLLEAEADQIGDTAVIPGVSTAAGAVSAGLTLDQLTEIDLVTRSGNPQLDNAKSLNLDASLEYFPVQGTAISLGIFSKTIKNFIFVGSESVGGGLDLGLIRDLLSEDAVSLIDQLGGLEALIEANIVDALEIVQPRNGDTATVRGIEFSTFHQFNYAPCWLSNVGFSTSLTYTDSEAEIAVVSAATAVTADGGLEDDEALVVLGFSEEGGGVYRTTDFFNSPSLSANLSLYYDSDNLEIALSLQHQSTSFDSVDDFGFDQYSGSYSQWDFYAEYELPEFFGADDLDLFVEIPDITDSGRKPTDLQSLGRNRRVIDEASFNGREITFGVRIEF